MASCGKPVGNIYSFLGQALGLLVLTGSNLIHQFSHIYPQASDTYQQARPDYFPLSHNICYYNYEFKYILRG